ncbi:MAG: ATP-binding protein [Anaerolineaceae bacterium]|nr:ATP-binding protein [Anaerolineaceae bacterium]
MKVSLKFKLAVVFIIISTLTAAVLYFVFINFNANRFDQFILEQQTNTIITALQDYYKSNQSWAGLVLNAGEHPLDCPQGQTCQPFNLSVEMGPGRGMGPGGRNGGEPRRLFGLADENGILIIPNRDNMPLTGLKLSDSVLKKGETIEVEGKKVGTLLSVARLPSYNAAEKQFLARTNWAINVAFHGAIFVSAIMGVILADRFSKRINDLKKAAMKMSQGDLSQQVKIVGRDEVSELGIAFNDMSKQLQTSNNLRKQMTADIAHDLRTPLTVIGGYIESMQDGDLDPTPERLKVINSEIGHLEKLVDDLRLLSRTDAGELKLNMQILDPAEMLNQVKEVFDNEATQKNVNVTVSARVGEMTISGDESRLMQVLENLMANALRYTPEGGKVYLKSSLLSTSGISHCLIEVRDSGSGIAEEELPLIFERFHRADKSRHTDENQSGLGLAIVKALVIAHQGEIHVESEIGKGTSFKILLPASHTEPLTE